jgi:hypothetical protein
MTLSPLEAPEKRTFRNWYEAAKNLPRSSAASAYQRRGFQFERAINLLLADEGLNPRTSFKPKGEQIDGSFLWGKRHFLLEARWQKKPVPESELLAFRGKVEGKLVGTIGVFISMSGYASNAADALVRGKALNVIMFDSKDMDACMEAETGFGRVLLAKLRIAAEEGVPNWPFAATIVTADKISEEEIDH